MSSELGTLCSDFYVNQRVALTMDLPAARQTVLDLFDRQTGGADREEQARVGVATARVLSPVNTAGKSVSGQCHECPPPDMAIRVMSRSGPILGTGSTAGQGKVGTGSSF